MPLDLNERMLGNNSKPYEKEKFSSKGKYIDKCTNKHYYNLVFNSNFYYTGFENQKHKNKYKHLLMGMQNIKM